MASSKILLRENKQKKDGSMPLVIRITKDRQSRYIFTGQYIDKKHWNPESRTVRKSHPNSARLNHLLTKKITEVNANLIESETNEKALSVDEIKRKVKNKAGGSFYEVAQVRINQKERAGTFSVSNAEKSILNNIKKFHTKEDLKFDAITPTFIRDFKVFCKTDLGQKSTRTVSNQLIFIRTVFNLAIKEGIARPEHYPFAGEKEKIRLKRSMKIGLSREEIMRIENLVLENGSSIWHAKNVFLFSFYFAGIRISDVLKIKWQDLKDGRLYYVMEKNDKPGSLKVPEQALRILKFYHFDDVKPTDFLFPDLKQAKVDDPKDVFTKTRTATKRINNHLKKIAVLVGIDKNLSSHISRHSFGNISGETIHPLMLQKLYRHSDLKTTINYQANFINKEADDALDTVLNG
ncbi:MAG: integrase [Crocinitomix sp.]|jgi:integrase